MVVDINITIDKLYLYLSTFTLDPETQVLFNESIRNRLTLSFDTWKIDRKTAEAGVDFQLDIGSASNITASK